MLLLQKKLVRNRWKINKQFHHASKITDLITVVFCSCVTCDEAERVLKVDMVGGGAMTVACVVGVAAGTG